MDDVIRFRFAQAKDFGGLLIVLREQLCMPFTPSHVECVTPEGKYLGQRMDGGMKIRDPGYDKNDIAHELFVNLPATPEQVKSFYDSAHKSIGQSYDWTAILDYAIPTLDLHKYNHSICSAKMLLCMRAAPAPVLHWPMTVPAHLVNPRDFLFLLSALVEIPH